MLHAARACAPLSTRPQAHSAKASATSTASSAAAPSMPVCWPSTQTSQTTVASIGNAIAVLKVAIQAPGRGIARATAGQALTTRYGSAMPRPSAREQRAAPARRAA